MSTPTIQHRRAKPIALVTVNRALTQSPPLGLLCLSAVLEDAGFATEVFDLAVRPEREAALLAGARDGRFAWVGFSAMTPAVPLVRELAEKIRALDPALPLVIGGVHASALPERTLRELPLTAVVVGEGSAPALTLAARFADGRRDLADIAGVAALEDDIFRHAPPDPDANQRPPCRPNWDRIDLADYQRCPPQYIRRHAVVAPVAMTRGCPHQCRFCAVPSFSGRRLARRDPVEVVDEIQYLAREKGVGEIHLLDDNFNVNLDYAKTVLREWARRDLGLVWKTPIGLWIHAYDDEWFDLLRRTGCYQVGFGIESGAPEILDRVAKKIDLDAVPGILARYRAAGISTFGFFILGLPGETPDTVARTIRFACAAPLDHVHVSQFTPYPGSVLFDEIAAREGALPDWDRFHHLHELDRFSACELSGHQLKAAVRRFYVRFYAQPRRAANMLGDIRRSGVAPFVALARRIYANG